MWLMPSSVRVYVAVSPVDFRCGFNRLISLVRGVLSEDPSTGHLFVFRNRRETQIKILFFDRTGYVVVHKRLEIGTIKLPVDVSSGASCVRVDTAELGLMLEGVELATSKRRRRWRAAG